ncbi:hypothetical protein EDB19DRAFT_1836092 [Suillus lakei]|nr:hypothetical protein EDB19DRAFT_1836092 [Suillus lakei]
MQKTLEEGSFKRYLLSLSGPSQPQDAVVWAARCAGTRSFEVITRSRSITESVAATKFLLQVKSHLITDANLHVGAVRQLSYSYELSSNLELDRVYPGDLWEIVGERIIEAKQEAVLRQHQSIWVGGFKRRRHVTLEHLLMEERKKRGQMEATREKCEAWLNRRHAYPLPNDEAWMENCSVLHGSTLSLPEFANTHDDNWTSDIFNCISPSLPLLNTWVTINAQEGFCDALHAERACQTGLLAQTLATQDNHPYERNIALEFLILHAKMRRAQAETDLYTMAIEHAREFDFSDNISATSSPGRFMSPPLPDELCYYDGDPDDEADDFDDCDSEFS